MKPVWEKILKQKVLLKAPCCIRDNIEKKLPHSTPRTHLFLKPTLAIFASILIIIGIWSYQGRFNLPLDQMNRLTDHLSDYELYEGLDLFVSYDLAELDEQDWEILVGENI